MTQSFNTYEHNHDRSLRVGDDDREQVASVLRDQHVAGRIDTDELQERLDRCYAAKTYGELDQLIADLPAQQTARRAGRPWSWPVIALVPLVVAAVALSGGRLLWLAFPLLFFVVRPLIWRSAYGRPSAGPIGCGARRGSTPGGYV
jgi:DUF1707 SHOCT-like domain